MLLEDSPDDTTDEVIDFFAILPIHDSLSNSEHMETRSKVVLEGCLPRTSHLDLHIC